MEPQITKLLGGGLNLLAPGDATPEGCALAAQNWRTDQAGNLRGRKSNSVAIASPGGNVHTIASVIRDGVRTRYYGADGNLFRDATELGSTFDGSPLGIVNFQDRVWVMNRSDQKKDDGSSYRNWTPTAPSAAATGAIYASAAAPTYAAGTGDGSTGALSGPIVYCVVGVVPGVGEVARSAALITTSHNGVAGLNWGTVPDSSWKGFSDKAVNTITPPTFADSAITEWNLYRVPIYKDPQQEPIVGTYNQIGYLVNGSPISTSATYTDTGTDLRGTGGDDQRDAGIVGRNITLVVSFSLNGNYNYYVTGVTDRNEETNPSPVLAATLAADGVKITAPTFSDPNVVSWNVYREGGPNSLPGYLLNQDPIAVATTVYSDTGKDNTGFGGVNQSDAGIELLGITLRTDRDPAPPARGLAGPYSGKLLAFNSAAHPNRIWWTSSLEPWNFPGSASDQDGNWVDIGEDGEEILAIAVFPRRIAILMASGVYRMVGDPDDWGSEVERTNAELGQIGAMAWTIAGPLVFGQGLEGVWGFNGDTSQRITMALDPVFKQDGVATIGASPSSAVNASVTNRGNACMAYRNGRLYFSYPSAASVSGVNDTTLVGEISGTSNPVALATGQQGARWFTDSRAFTALYDEGQQGWLLGAYGGSVYALESGDEEASIPLVYQSRYENQGAPENDKRYSDVLVEHNTQGRAFTVYAYLDNGATIVNLGTFSSTAWTQTSFTLDDTEHRNVSVRLESDAGNQPAEIYTLAVHYLPFERNARTYDSGRVPLAELSLLNALALELDILSGSVTYTFSAGTDELAAVQSATLAGPAVETFLIALPAAQEGQWVRLELSGDDFRCAGARLQYQPIGAALYPRAPEVLALLPVPGGASPGVLVNSRTYDTGKVALEKTSLLGAVEVDLEIVSDSVAYTVYGGITELDVLARGTFEGADHTFTVQLPDGIEARWVRVVLTGDNYRCHGARLQIQPYGAYLVGVEDIFRSGDLTFGSPRPKLYQQMRVDCDPDGTIPGNFYSDFPGQMASRQILELIQTEGRTWQRQNFPVGTQGRVCRVEFTAPFVCRLYAIQVRVKVLGEPGGWEWKDVPVPPTPPGFSWMPLPIQ